MSDECFHAQHSVSNLNTYSQTSHVYVLIDNLN